MTVINDAAQSIPDACTYVIGGAEFISVPIEASAKKAGHLGRGITALPAAMP